MLAKRGELVVRIEIINNSNAANSLSVLNENLSAMISQSEATLSSLQTIKQFSYSMNGGVGSLQNAVDSVSSRMEQEETTKNNLIAVRTKLEEFLTTVQTIDAEVSEKVTQNEEEFYRVTGWKKPAGVIDLDKWFENTRKWLNSKVLDAANNVLNHVGIYYETDYNSLSKEELENICNEYIQLLESGQQSEDDKIRMQSLLNYLSSTIDVNNLNDENKTKINLFNSLYEAMPEHLDEANKMVTLFKDSPAEFQGDINAIKFIAYSSQGDCHDLFFKYAGNIKIGDYYYTNSDGEKRNCFNLESMSMRLNIEAIRDDKSGYRTFFHESGHNIDALIGKEKTGENNYYTSTKLSDGKFHDVIYKEVEGIVVNVVNDYSDNEKKLSDGDKALITDVLMGRKHESEIKNSSVDFAYRKILEDITGAWKGKYSRQYQVGKETGILENANARMLSEVMNGMTNNSVIVDSYNDSDLLNSEVFSNILNGTIIPNVSDGLKPNITPGHPINWQNPDPNAGYVPHDYYYNADGSYTGFAETEFMAEYMRINMTKSNDEKTYVKSYLRNSWDTLEDELKSDVLMQN